MTARVLLYAALIAAALFAVFPFFWMVTTSFKTMEEASSPSLWPFPDQWMWGNYVETFRAAPFGTYFFFFFVIAAASTAAVVFTSLLAGYAFARLEFPARGFVFAAVLATMMIPFEVILIPNYVFITRLGWINTYAALIVPWCANAFSIFLVRQAFLSLPNDFFDAARVDGCGHVQFALLIGAPLVRPALVAVALFAFLGSYNALLWPLVVTNDDEMRVVQVGLTVFSGAEGVRVQLLMAASVIVILPTVALYFLAQRYFVEGAFGAAVKN